VKIFDWHKKAASGFLPLFALLFDVAAANSFRLSNRKTPRQELRHPSFPAVIVNASIFTVVAERHLPVAPGRLTAAPGMKRLGCRRQKLPLSLHRTRILKGASIFVCSLLYTFRS
jgi:hypothetical protein